MTGIGRYRFIATIVSALLLVAIPASAEVTTTSGGAFGASVDVAVLGLPVTSPAAPTVTLPPTGGGPVTDNLTVVDVPGLLRTGLLEVATEGALGPTGFAASSADVANVRVGPATGPVLTAQAVHSQCRSDSAGSTGSATLANVSIAGASPVDLAPGANTVIPVPGVGEVRLNEQSSSGAGGSTSIIVNAIHVVLDGPLGVGHIIIAQSRCGVSDQGVIISESRNVVLLPVAGAAVFGLVFFMVRRRRVAGQQG